MRIAAISDIHGHLPSIPDCDVLAIAGDISPSYMTSVGEIDHKADYKWWMQAFGPWLVKIVERGIVPIAIGGNHDFLCESFGDEFTGRFPWIYLCDSGVEYGGLKWWGTPWQPYAGNWAWNAPEFDQGEEFLASKFSQIPYGTDVLIAHSPPAGILDGGRHIGSHALNRRIQEIMPRLTVFGHCHQHGGRTEMIEGCMLSNVAMCDYRNRLVREPMLFEL